MRHHLLSLLLLVLTFGWLGDAAAGGVVTLTKHQADGMQAEQQHIDREKHTRDGLCDANAHKHHPSAATLSDAHDIYRICNSRPGRVLPTYGSKPGRTLGKQPFNHKSNTCYSLLNRRKQRLETSPFATAASCEYYVIALRHIIR